MTHKGDVLLLIVDHGPLLAVLCGDDRHRLVVEPTTRHAEALRVKGGEDLGSIGLGLDDDLLGRRRPSPNNPQRADNHDEENENHATQATSIHLIDADQEWFEILISGLNGHTCMQPHIVINRSNGSGRQFGRLHVYTFSAHFRL